MIYITIKISCKSFAFCHSNLYIFSSYSYVFSAPGKLLDSLPGTLMLTDCLEACQGNETCHAVNYETGLCVLFSANADQLPGKFKKSLEKLIAILKYRQIDNNEHEELTTKKQNSKKNKGTTSHR